MDNNYNKMMGIFNKKRTVNISSLPTPGQINSNETKTSLKKYEDEINNCKTLLDIFKYNKAKDNDESSFQVFIPSKTNTAVLTCDENIEVKLYAAGDNEIMDIPIVNFNYQIKAPENLDIKSVVDGIKNTKKMFEGELVFDMLGKAFRSQKNRILTDKIDDRTIEDAIGKMGSSNHSVYKVVSTPEMSERIKKTANLCDDDVILFSPYRRGNQKRAYFIDNPSKFCCIHHSNGRINDDMSYSCDIGLMIFNRDPIVCVLL